MKPILPGILILLAISSSQANEIHLNELESPDDAAVFYLSDSDNRGEIVRADFSGTKEESVGFHVGDIGDSNNKGSIRKDFLVFRLPALDGRKLSRATLRLDLVRVTHDAADKPMPPASLFHAEKWNDESWQETRHGLQNQHFADTEVFLKKIPLCGPDAKPGVIELDVTDMIRADYLRSPNPAAVFRLEISDFNQLDVADSLANAYRFTGPGAVSKPDKVPTLVLAFED